MAARQLPSLEDCEEVARRYFGRDDVRVANWKERTLGDGKPAGLLGAHKLVEVNASSDGKERTIHIFVKTLPENESQTSLIESTGAFKKEFLFYNDIVRAWEGSEIISKKSLGERQDSTLSSDELSWSCRFYIARGDLIVLENVALLGYKSDSARNVYDYEHVLLVLKKLAAFHACSLIFEEDRSKHQGKPYRIGDEIPEMIQETFYLVKDGHAGEAITEAAVIGLTECAKKLSVCQKDSKKRRLVEERLPGVLRRILQAVKASSRYRNVLCHADLWQNNIMFKKDSAGRPEDVILVDFQLLRYAPPAHDIYDLLYLTLRRNLREQHEAELLEAYYSALGAILRRRGLDPAVVFPQGEFLASLEEQRFAGRLNAVFALHFLLSDEETLGPIFSDPQEYDRVLCKGEFRARMIWTQFERDQVYRERMEECLMELLEKDVFL